MDSYVDLYPLQALVSPFQHDKDIVWDIRCSTGSQNICEMNGFMLLSDDLSKKAYFPPTNLRIIDGWIPKFDHEMARKLRNETKILVIQNCNLQFFVIREMLRILFLPHNMIEKIELTETDAIFELEWLRLEHNLLTNISFISRFTKLDYLDLSENHLEVLELKLFENLQNLSVLDLRGNRIKSIEASLGLNYSGKNLGLANNQLTDLNTKNWFSITMTDLSIQDNKFQSINTIQLGKSVPKLSSIRYARNPWNCGRLNSLQFYLETRPHKVYNLSRQAPARCQDESTVHTVALKLPELVDLAEDSLENYGITTHKLIDDRDEKLKLAKAQSRFVGMQKLLKAMEDGLVGLEQTYNTVRKSVNWLDFF